MLVNIIETNSNHDVTRNILCSSMDIAQEKFLAMTKDRGNKNGGMLNGQEYFDGEFNIVVSIPELEGF